ncbi:DUF2726 domain-containing protein [Acinetobacter baumannii]|uniref:DUF2726 domain-containing protein n=1 Tax=Acinetobacter baumannii TaxID=470 RepID=UPI00387A5F48
MFESSHLFFIILGCLSTCIFLLVCLRPYLFPKQKFFARPVITNFETQMFIRLKQSFPSYHVLAQVAFSALITSNDYKVRSQFNRKVTDFVLLDENMEVIAIIELDDRSLSLNRKMLSKKICLYNIDIGYFLTLNYLTIIK